ncbi:BURP domain protein RD22-like isoform X1 [Mercurialis annua]|uniref:BURP domain protein RD22-like isoform X1 n=2 Tax=Mercurialis annua TaxID=3986 RepID=UPI00215EFD61|nr:BURP domain protein RD22-like isoform X1 [Mercurialis annua]
MNMELHLLPIFALLLCLLKEINGSLSPEMYWKSKLPNTPLPIALQELLKPGNIASNLSEIEEPSDCQRSVYNLGYYQPTKATTSDSTNAINNTTLTIFFLHDDLYPGKKMYLNIKKVYNSSNFLPRKITKTIPFSTKNYSEILKYFSTEPASKEAQMIKHTIEQCEAPKMKGEIKYCATSLESLVDFVVSKIGKNVYALANEVDEEENNKKQNYAISNEIKTMGDHPIVCHKQIYKYAVFYCHVIMGTEAYMVPLVGEDGSKAKAVVICHSDTSDWNPNHIAFQLLKVKPGGPSICHFLNRDGIIWISNL